MNVILKNKGLLVFYLVVVVFAYFLVARVEKLDQKEDINNNKSLVVNLW
jgi:preprotein translocase subunit YajC